MYRNYSKLTLKKLRGVFRALSNIYDGAFLWKLSVVKNCSNELVSARNLRSQSFLFPEKLLSHHTAALNLVTSAQVRFQVQSDNHQSKIYLNKRNNYKHVHHNCAFCPQQFRCISTRSIRVTNYLVLEPWTYFS